MAIFKLNKFGIVLTDKRLVIGRNGKLIINQPGCVTRYKPTGELYSPGAIFCIGLCYNGQVSFPVKLGVVCDFEGASFMLSEYLREFTHWFQRINSVGNLAMRGKMTESEIRALRDCSDCKNRNVFYMQEIIASVLELKDVIVIYIAADFIEIALVKDYKIIKLFAKECAVKGLRNSILNFVDERNLRIGENTVQQIITDFFCGEDITIYAPNKVTSMPSELKLYSKDILSISSSWLDTVVNYIENFVRENKIIDNLYLMSDYDNVDFLSHELSSRCYVKINPINNALEQIAIKLSLR